MQTKRERISQQATEKRTDKKERTMEADMPHVSVMIQRTKLRKVAAKKDIFLPAKKERKLLRKK